MRSLELSDLDGEVFSVDFAFEKNWFVEKNEHPILSPDEMCKGMTSSRLDEDVPLARLVSNLLTPDECQQVVALCEKFGFRQNGKRPASLAWVTLPEWTDGIRDRLLNLPGQPYGTTVRINHRWRVYKYGADCELPRHKDRACVPSYFFAQEGTLRAHPGELTDQSLLIYINPDGDHEGGSTRLFGVDGCEKDVPALCGNAVTFPHRGELYPDDEEAQSPGGGLWHAGLPVTGGTKYIVRTDIIL